MSSKEAILDILLSVNIKNILKQYSINIRKTKSNKVICMYIYNIYIYIVLSWPFPATSLKTMINQKCGKMCFENALRKNVKK